ncbi:hypothetical protein [Paenibacillus sp. sgz500958]|uniref:hypothetical protein n=1 Tax=Paenibacillus sp. sgz500958 TaxID=3242475 RepID=UPI0036D22112
MADTINIPAVPEKVITPVIQAVQDTMAEGTPHPGMDITEAVMDMVITRIGMAAPANR